MSSERGGIAVAIIGAAGLVLAACIGAVVHLWPKPNGNGTPDPPSQTACHIGRWKIESSHFENFASPAGPVDLDLRRGSYSMTLAEAGTGSFDYTGRPVWAGYTVTRDYVESVVSGVAQFDYTAKDGDWSEDGDMRNIATVWVVNQVVQPTVFGARQSATGTFHCQGDDLELFVGGNTNKFKRIS